MISHRRSRLSMSHLERRIGMKLPEWICGTTAVGVTPPTLIEVEPLHHYHRHKTQSGPLSTPACHQTGFIHLPMLMYEARPLANCFAGGMPPPFTSKPPPSARCNSQDDGIYNSLFFASRM